MKGVTLLVVEGVKSRWDQTQRVFDHCRRLFDFGAEHYLALDISREECLAMEAGGFLPYVETPHVLICTWDGFIVNPELWRHDWLEYDMIGAPWPEHWTKHRVGNTGFTLQSRKFLQTAQAHRASYPSGQPGDVWLCQTMHDQFVAEGIKYAPVEEAAPFSFEHPALGSGWDQSLSFGFHGWVSGKSQQSYYARL